MHIAVGSDPFTPTGLLNISDPGRGNKPAEPRRLMDADPSRTLDDPTYNDLEGMYFKGGSHREKGLRVSAMRTKLLAKTSALGEHKTSTPITEDDVYCQNQGKW